MVKVGAKPQKLLRKDVLKLIDNLTRGEYNKGSGGLVRTENGVDRFCCLGVWADQHGCVWSADEGGYGFLIPVIQKRGKTVISNDDSCGLSSPFRFGLSDVDVQQLSSLNDRSNNWKEVLHYIVDELLPRAE